MSRCGMMDLTFIAKPLRQLNRLVELDISYNKYALFSSSLVFSLSFLLQAPTAHHAHNSRTAHNTTRVDDGITQLIRVALEDTTTLEVQCFWSSPHPARIRSFSTFFVLWCTESEAGALRLVGLQRGGHPHRAGHQQETAEYQGTMGCAGIQATCGIYWSYSRHVITLDSSTLRTMSCRTRMPTCWPTQ